MNENIDASTTIAAACNECHTQWQWSTSDSFQCPTCGGSDIGDAAYADMPPLDDASAQVLKDDRAAMPLYTEGLCMGLPATISSSHTGCMDVHETSTVELNTLTDEELEAQPISAEVMAEARRRANEPCSLAEDVHASIAVLQKQYTMGVLTGADYLNRLTEATMAMLNAR